MHINDFCDDLILVIFAYFDLRTRRCAGETCRRWSALSRRSWKNLNRITLYTLYEPHRIPKGKYLNRALHWVLKRCGKSLKILNMADPDPENRFVKANERTFRIIGRHCPELEEINFTCMLLLNDLLHELVKQIDCSKLKRINMNCSFNHYCTVHDGLDAMYKACPKIEYLNISSSLNARVRDCAELWPATLKEVYIDHAWALTPYSIWSLTKCCTNLLLFSMCGRESGMDGGIKCVFRLNKLRTLYLDEYPGDTELGIGIGQLQNLHKLRLRGSSMVNDEVIKAIAQGCKKLQILDLGVPRDQAECTRHGVLTDEGLLAIAYHLPNLKILNIEGRLQVTDESVTAILSNGHLEKLSMSESELITDTSINALAAYCGHRIYELHLSKLNNITSVSILDLCKIWFQNCTKDTGYNFHIYLDEMCIDIGDFIHTFQSVTKDSVHEFIVQADGDRPRRTIQLYCDMLISLYSY